MLTHELIHVGFSLLAGLIIYRSYKKWQVFIVTFVSGFLVDVDHIFDYFFYKKSFVFDLIEFSSGKFFDITNKVYVLLHAYEYSLICFAIGAILLASKKTTADKKGLAFVALAFGLSLFFHLVFDTISYKPKWPAYSIVYRMYLNFNHDSLGFK